MVITSVMIYHRRASLSEQHTDLGRKLSYQPTLVRSLSDHVVVYPVIYPVVSLSNKYNLQADQEMTDKQAGIEISVA